MKKVGILAGILFVSAIAFMGCSSSSGNSGKVEDVSASDVLEEAEAEGIVLNSYARAIENQEDFERYVKPEIISLISSSNLVSGIKNLNQISSTADLSAARAAVTDSDISKSINDLYKQAYDFKTEFEKLELFGECDASIDWEMPSGQYKVQNGLKLDIDDVSFEAKVKGTYSRTPYALDINLAYGLDFDVTGFFNFQKALGINSIPYAKVALKGKSDIDGYGKHNTASSDFKIDTDIYYGYSGAWIFNLSSYAGVLKMDLEITADATIDKDFVQKYSDLLNGSFNKYNLNESFFNDLPIDGSLYITVYDVKGNKKFSYVAAKSLWEIYKQFGNLI